MRIDSFVVIVSRYYPIRKCLEAIDKADIPRKELYLLLFLDTKDRLLIDYCKRWLYKQEKKWFSAEMIITGNNPIDVKKPKDNILKWERIIDNMKRIIIHTDFSEIVFMVEDDTIIPEKSFKKLYRRINKDESIGCIQGVEAVRQAGEKGCCGAWLLEIDNKVKKKIGLKAKKAGIEEIDGGGYYCWAFRQKAIKGIELRYSWQGWCGSDVWTWYDIKNNGWKTLVDWSIWCEHLAQKKGELISITPENTRNWLFDFERGTDDSPKIDFDFYTLHKKQ